MIVHAMRNVFPKMCLLPYYYVRRRSQSIAKKCYTDVNFQKAFKFKIGVGPRLLHDSKGLVKLLIGQRYENCGLSSGL
jgi:hypothetical protein